jgi:ketosteroid isomerase-like protein
MTDDAVRSQLIAVEDAWSRALVANDADQISAYIGDEWVLVSDAGVMAAERFLGVISSGELTHSAMAAVGERRVRIYGDTAVITARMISTATFRGNRADADEWTTDVFVRRDGRWLCTLTQITPTAGPMR